MSWRLVLTNEKAQDGPRWRCRQGCQECSNALCKLATVIDGQDLIDSTFMLLQCSDRLLPYCLAHSTCTSSDLSCCTGWLAHCTRWPSSYRSAASTSVNCGCSLVHVQCLVSSRSRLRLASVERLLQLLCMLASKGHCHTWTAAISRGPVWPTQQTFVTSSVVPTS